MKFVGERYKQKAFPTDSNVLQQKTLSLYQHASKRSPIMNDTKPFTASKR